MSDDEVWYLPKFMQDFHVQKDLFRSVSSYDAKALRTADEIKCHPAPHWIVAHVYVIDVFLRFMAEHGYTLQRCRRDMEFQDIEHRIGADRSERMASSRDVLNQVLKAGK